MLGSAVNKVVKMINVGMWRLKNLRVGGAEGVSELSLSTTMGQVQT